MATHPMQLLVEFAVWAAQTFVAGLWQGCLLVSGVALCLRSAARIRAGKRFAVWMLTFTLVLLLPLLSWPGRAEAATRVSAFHLDPKWALLLVAVWALWMAARAVQLLAQGWRLRLIWRRAEPIEVAGQARALLGKVGRGAVLCLSNDVASPGVIGFFSPRLLVPKALYATLTPRQLRHIVLHECEHLRRNDDWLNLLQKVALVLFPLNPALRWLDRRLALEREMACDDGVVAATAAPLAYARCLTQLAEQRLGHHPIALLLPAWSRQAELARRVQCLLRPAHALSPLRAQVSILLLCLGMAGAAVEMARVPGLVCFDGGAAQALQRPSGVASAKQPLMPGLAHAQPAIASGSSPARAELVSAILTPKPRQATRLRMTARRLTLRASMPGRTSVAQLVRMNVASPGRAPRDPAPRLVYTLTELPSYAAVPFGNGWLIVQL